MKWWKKIKMYKNLFLTVLVLNAFLIVTGVTFIVRHYQGQRQTEKAYQTHIQELKVLDQVALKLDELEKVQTWTGEHWLKLGELQGYVKSNLPESKVDFAQALATQTPTLAPIKKNLVDEKARSLNALVESGKDLGNYREEIMWITILSILLGFILPSLVLYQLKRQTLKFHAQIEGQAISAITTWRAQTVKYQDKGGLNSSLFWLDVALLTLAQVTKVIDHPAAAYAHQLSQKFYQELQGGTAANENTVENDQHLP